MKEETKKFVGVQASVLKRLRVIAACAIAVCALMPVAAVLVLGKESLQKAGDNQASANRAAIAVFIAAAVFGIGGRMQAYKANWQGDVVTPAGYQKGILRYVGAVVAGMGIATVIGLWVRHPSASIDLAIFALGLLVFGFPNGKPMLPQLPELGRK